VPLRGQVGADAAVQCNGRLAVDPTYRQTLRHAVLAGGSQTVREGRRQDGLGVGVRTVPASSDMTIRRTVIETAGEDHRTLTWIVSPMVPRMIAWWSHWQPTQWDQRRRNVPMAADGWLTTRTVCGQGGRPSPLI
jgi:hypothetical protein